MGKIQIPWAASVPIYKVSSIACRWQVWSSVHHSYTVSRWRLLTLPHNQLATTQCSRCTAKLAKLWRLPNLSQSLGSTTKEASSFGLVIKTYDSLTQPDLLSVSSITSSAGVNFSGLAWFFCTKNTVFCCGLIFWSKFCVFYGKSSMKSMTVVSQPMVVLLCSQAKSPFIILT